MIENLTLEQRLLGENRIKEEASKIGIKLNDNLSLFEKTRAMFELAFASKAEHVTLTMQDILFQGKEARMNEPGTVNNDNWTYRFLWHDLSNDVANDLKKLIIKYHRER